MVKKIVKVCGLKSTDAAAIAIESGASLLGTILVPNRARTVDPKTAREISKLCYAKRIEKGSKYLSAQDLKGFVNELDIQGPEWFEKVAETIAENGPYLVGVFRNQALKDVKQISEDLNIDIIQLHGSEDVNLFASELIQPVIPRFVLNKPGFEESLSTHKFLIPLLDSEAGGEGKLINWDDASSFGNFKNGRFILAGGLDPENVGDALQVEGCLGVDVSGGVETDGAKDINKIKYFVSNAKASIM
jgi:phosphoribosylanthranilate isomerase